MSDPNVYQQLGSLQAKVGVLEQGQRDMSAKLDVLIERSTEERASRTTAGKIAAMSGAVGGFFVAVAAVFVQWYTGAK
jgi:hypothetical protein